MSHATTSTGFGLLADRYDIRRLLGHGGMGSVYLANDRERRCDVAVKVLHPHVSRRAFDLKREFRALANVRHSNLVRLLDLHLRDGQFFLTMAYITGVAMSELPVGTPADVAVEARGIALALQAVHRADLVHCDVKPNNILVDPQRGPVLLDFGLVAPVVDPTESQRLPAGTLAYMAPEVIRGASPHPSRDVFAFGRVLYERLTGVDFMAEDLVGLGRGVVPAAELPVMTPQGRSLLELARAMMKPDPGQRPDIETVLRALGHREGNTPRRTAEQWLGRQREGAQLRDYANADHLPAWVSIEGPSGVGKTYLVQQFMRAAAAEGHLVLFGGCHANEHVPYQGLDSALDDLLDHVRTTPLENWPELRGATAPLATMFPAFEALPRLGEPSNRDSAVGALRATLRRAAARLVLVLDDAQWLPADTLDLLGALLSGPDGPPVLLVTTARSGAGQPTPDRIGALLRQTIQLGPLDPGTTLKLARELAPEVSLDDVQRFASETGGNPFLIVEFAPSLSTDSSLTLDAAIAARIDQCGPGAPEVMERSVVAQRPLRFAELGPQTDLDTTLSKLQSARLLRTELTAGGARFRPWHDRIADFIDERLTPAKRSELHARLADELLASGDADDGALATHLVAAGRGEAALPHLVAAATGAARANSYPLAAACLDEAVRIAPDAERDALEVLRAQMLANAGRATEAAEAWLALAARPRSNKQAAEFETRAAEQLLYSGNLERGREAIGAALRRVGERLPTSALWSFVYLFLQQALRKLRGMRATVREGQDVPPELLEKVDVLRNASLALSHYESLNSAALGVRHLNAALAAGESGRVGAALAIHTSQNSAFKADPARTTRVLSQARAYARAGDDPASVALVEISAAGTAWLEGRLDDANALSEPLIRQIESLGSPGVWQRDTAWLVRLGTLLYAGRWDLLRYLVPRVMAEGKRRGDLYLMAQIRVRYATVAHLAADRPDLADRELDDIAGERDGVSYDLVDMYVLLNRVRTRMYQDRHAEALALLDAERWRAMKTMLPFTDFYAIVLASLELRCLAHLGQQSKRRYRKALRVLASRSGRHPMAAAWQAAFQSDDVDDVRRLFEVAGMRLQAQVIAWSDEPAAAQAALKSAGIDNPRLAIRMLAPRPL